MRMTNRVLFLLLMLALAVPVVAAPATAFAQSAGDDQYVDPFQDDQTGNGNSDSQGNGSNDTPSSDQSASQAPADTGDTAAANAAGEAAASATTLPRTGMPVGEFALIGVILLAGGFALRRAWPLPD